MKKIIFLASVLFLNDTNAMNWCKRALELKRQPQPASPQPAPPHASPHASPLSLPQQAPRTSDADIVNRSLASSGITDSSIINQSIAAIFKNNSRAEFDRLYQTFLNHFPNQQLVPINVHILDTFFEQH
ncbi:MAG: hypothetical protein LBJ71_02265, partial [Holosporaceae bacterium]|nr:hypothetical protein [Holosporaceae bacterium]